MQTIDETVFGTGAKNRKRARTTLCAFCKAHFLYADKAAHQCPGKVEAYKERLCAWAECEEDEGKRKIFKPLHCSATFCCGKCKHRARDAAKREWSKRRGAKKPPATTPEERLAAETAPLRRREDAAASCLREMPPPLMGEALYRATMRLMKEET